MYPPQLLLVPTIVGHSLVNNIIWQCKTLMSSGLPNGTFVLRIACPQLGLLSRLSRPSLSTIELNSLTSAVLSWYLHNQWLSITHVYSITDLEWSFLPSCHNRYKSIHPTSAQILRLNIHHQSMNFGTDEHCLFPAKLLRERTNLVVQNKSIKTVGKVQPILKISKS